MNKLESMMEIADIHANRIRFALGELQSIFPLQAGDIVNMSERQLLLIELLVGRFAKLQDYLGKSVIDAFLDLKGEPTSHLAMLDKIHLLEKFGIIEDSAIWQEMRDARNHAAHEYPDHPELTARYLNRVFSLSPKLLGLLDVMRGEQSAKLGN